jgi:hypothetical protein
MFDDETARALGAACLGTRYADSAQMAPPLRASHRRQSNRRLLTGVLALAVGVTVLVVALVGLGRTVGALTRLAPAAAEQLSSEPPAAQLAARGLPIATVATTTVATATAAPAAPAANGLRSPEAATPPSTAMSAARSDTMSVATGSVMAGVVAGAGGSGGQGGIAGGQGGIAGGGLGGLGGAAGALGAAPLGTVPCGPTTCSEGQSCCNASCGICAAPGETCTQQLCGVANVASSVMCGANTCNVGQVCCNASCGICTAPGASCSQAPCASAPRSPTNFMCGRAQCSDGQICCNPSCGTCVAPGGSCSHEICD